MRYVTLLILISLVFCFDVYADTPSVVSYNSATRVVTCTGAGTKSTPEPIKFDDMETGEVNQDLTMSGWSNSNDGAIYNADQAYSGSLAAYNYVATDGGRGGFDTAYLEFTETDTVYLSFYFRINVPYGGGYGVQKSCRIASPDATIVHYNGPGTLKMGNLDPYYNYQYDVNSYDPGDGTVSIGNITIGEDAWYRFEYIHKLSTPGVADGESSIIQVGGDSTVNKNIMNRNEGETFTLYSVLLGLMCPNIGNVGETPTRINMWIDDVFIDNTTQRVVIGDNPVFTSCTKRDDQSATAWSDTSITLGTLNTPSFATGETMYLFVVGPDGVASAGLEIDPAPIEITGVMLSSGGAIEFK